MFQPSDSTRYYLALGYVALALVILFGGLMQYGVSCAP